MNSIQNDIAIIKLKTNITFTNLIQPGCLNLRYFEYFYGTPLYAAGKFI